MNIPLLLLTLLAGHVIGDFYLQTNNMAHNKKTSRTWLAAHGAIYAVCMALALLVLVRFGGVAFSGNLIWIFVWTSCSHIAVDFLKRRVTWERRFTANQFGRITALIEKHNLIKAFFLVDQAIHLAFIFIAYWFWGRGLVVGCYIYEYTHQITIAFGLLCILRPVSSLLESGFVWDLNLEDSQKNASRMIGYLERIIVYFFVLNGEFSAIALVIAVKAIVKFPDLKSDQNYLHIRHYTVIGTFLSLTAVLAIVTLLGLLP